MLRVVLIWPCADDSAIRYVLPILCVTLCFDEFTRWRHCRQSCSLYLEACSLCYHIWLSKILWKSFTTVFVVLQC